MDPSVRIRNTSSEVTVFLRLRLGCRQSNEEIVKRGSPARGKAPFAGVYKKTENHRQKQCRSRTVRSSIGRVRSKGCREQVTWVLL